MEIISAFAFVAECEYSLLDCINSITRHTKLSLNISIRLFIIASLISLVIGDMYLSRRE